MTQTESRQIRVFISSTFRDMQAERDYLVKFIFPQLRKLCESRSVTWGEVDLRWGITDEQSAEGKVLPICLAEIERSRPYFIGLLGERYGWIPDSIDPELIAQEPWLAQHLEHSVTELEILHGVLNDSEMNDKALFYFRDPAYIDNLDESELADHIEVHWREDIESYGMEEALKRVRQRQEKLSSLKDRIRQSGLPLRENFQSPQQLGEWILADLTRIIDQRFPEEDKPDPLSRENALHDAFAQNRARLYIGGEAYFTALDQHAAQGKLPLVLLGESGSGKSALLANWALRYQREHPDSFVICHFIGASPSSADLTSMLLRIMRLLKQRFDLPGELPENDKQIRSDFTNWLAMAAARGKLVLVLDGLNQLDNRDSAQELDWLPLELPENLTILLSTLTSRALEVIRELDWPSLSVLPLSLEERIQIVQKYLAFYSKELSPARIQRIVEDPQSENPLALRLLLDELRQFGRHEALDDVIDRYLAADSLPEMFQIKLERLEEDLEKEQPGLVRRALTLLWAARFGLSEVELLEVLGEPGQPLPGRFWSPLSLALESSLVDRSGLLSFYHDFLRQAVEERYLKDEQSKTEARLTLANYFERQEELSERKRDEFPWQLSQAKDWKRLYEFLIDPNSLIYFAIDLRYSSPILYQLEHYWSLIELNSNLRAIEGYSKIIENPLYSWIKGWLIEFLPKIGQIQSVKKILNSGKNREGQDANQMDMISIKEKASLLLEAGKLQDVENIIQNLRRKYEITKQPYELIVALEIQTMKSLKANNFSDAHNSVNQLIELSIQLDDKFSLNKALGQKGNVLFQEGKKEEAIQCYNESLEFWTSVGEIDNLSITLFNLALCYWDLDNFEKASEILNKQENYCRKTGNLTQLYKSLKFKAKILFENEQFLDSFSVLSECITLAKYLSLNREEIICYLEQVQVLKKTSEWINALEIIEIYLNLNETMQDPYLSDAILTEYSNILVELKRYKLAYEVICKHEMVLKKLQDTPRLVNALGNKAWLLIRLNESKKALFVLNDMESISRSINYNAGIIRALTEKFSIFGKLGYLHDSLNSLKQIEDLLITINDIPALRLNLENQIIVSSALGDPLQVAFLRDRLKMLENRC